MSLDVQPAVLLQHERQQRIHTLALQDGSVDVAALAKRFGVTTETIRRDLSELQDRRLLRRVHGGAVPVERADHEPKVDVRDTLNAAEKLRIGKAAARYAPEHGSVLIDSGSTGQRLAEVLNVTGDIHVVTNSLMTALTLSRRGLRDLTVLGGTVRTNTYAMVDATAHAALEGMAVDVLFVGCDGVSFQRGLTTPYREEQAIKRAMMQRAEQVIAVVDYSKFGNNQLYSFAELDDIDVLITDDRLDDEAVDLLAGHGIAVVRA